MRMRPSPRGLWSRRQVWLPRMRQRDPRWAGEVSLRGSPYTRLRDGSPVSRYLYIDLWLYLSTVQRCVDVIDECDDLSVAWQQRLRYDDVTRELG